MHLIHISDTHIHMTASDNRAVATKLKALVKKMDADKKVESLVILSGDVVDDGWGDQYKQAKKLLSPFQGRILLVPGQHDLGAIGTFYDEEAVDRFRSLRAFLQAGSPTRPTLNLHFMLVDSCLHTPEVVDLAMGAVPASTIKKIRELPFSMTALPGAAKTIVVLHHTPLHQKWYLRLKNAQEFLNAALGRVDLILCGHDHGAATMTFPDPAAKKPVRTLIQQAPALYLSKAMPLYLDV